jgi:hypothetical protein
MDSLAVPTTAAQAKAFISPSSLSFPMSADALKSSSVAGNGATEVKEIKPEVDESASGIVPTLQ